MHLKYNILSDTYSCPKNLKRCIKVTEVSGDFIHIPILTVDNDTSLVETVRFFWYQCVVCSRLCVYLLGPDDVGFVLLHEALRQIYSG